MKDRGRLRGAFRRRLPIKLVVEDGFDGAIGPGADLDGPLGGGLDARRAKGTGEPDDAETGAIALFWMGPAFEDLLAERRSRRADLAGVFPGCARSSSRRSADGWRACARERSCAFGSRSRADERRCARPYGKSRRRGRSVAPRPRRERSGRGQNNSGRRCRRDSQRRPAARATRCIRRARWAALSAPGDRPPRATGGG